MVNILKKTKKFIFEHKFEIGIGIVTGVLVTGYLLSGVNNSCVAPIGLSENKCLSTPKIDNSLLSSVNNAAECTLETTTRNISCGEFSVSQHLRNLPIGQTHSAANEALAHLAGIENLSPNQSFIHSYNKNVSNLI